MTDHEADPKRDGAMPYSKRDGAMPNPKQSASSNTVKDPDDWTTGEEPMTGAQASYLKTLSEEAHEPFDSDDLTKAEASKRIDALREKAGR